MRGGQYLDYTTEDLKETRVRDVPFLLPERYLIDKAIGKGSYGMVVEALDNDCGQKVAIKKNKEVFPATERRNVFSRRSAAIVEPINMNKQSSPTEEDEDALLRASRLLREVKIMIHLEHENVINLRDVILPPNFDSFRDIYFVMDLMPADLRDFLKLGRQLPDAHVQFLMYQLMMGLSYMHSADLIHRDIKPENILVDQKCGVKLCDFGIARGVDFKRDPHMSTIYVQTRWYRAPELLLEYTTVSKAIDVWSCGCVFAELLQKGVLFPGRSPAHQVELILKLLGTPKDITKVKGSPHGIDFLSRLNRHEGMDLQTKFPGCNPLALDLLSKMLTFDPDNRITAEEAMKHPFFASIYSPEDHHTAKIFDFKYEKKLDTMMAIKEEAFATILEYNGVLERRRSSIVQGLEVPPPSFANHTAMLLRRFSKDGDVVPEEHKEIFAKFKEMFANHNDPKAKDSSAQDVINSESVSGFHVNMGSHMTRVLNGTK